MSDRKIQALKNMISNLEGRTFGPHLQFTTISNKLRFSANGGWDEIHAFEDVFKGDELRDFAEKLNAATYPIRMEFIAILKQELSNTCVKLAAEEMNSVPEIKYETDKRKRRSGHDE